MAAIVLCAGSSQRFGEDKLELKLQGQPVWMWSVEAFARHPEVDEVVVVGNEARRDLAETLAGVSKAVIGGNTRQQSVRNGLAALSADVEFALIHDGARPLLSQALISRVLGAVRVHPAVTPALPMTDTVWQGQTLIDRETLAAVQTPQAFHLDKLNHAYESADEATDDASVMRQAGFPITYVEGDKRNVKLTTVEDFDFALRLIQSPAEVRTGLGYDIHSFSTDRARPLWLGGVHFPDHLGLEGHSDADALMHAVVDACLGAAGMGDIGALFPNTDPSWKDRRSAFFLEEAARQLAHNQWEIVHIDATVLAESPKIMPRASEIREAIAFAAKIQAHQVSVKATTHEQLGAIGRREGIAAMAVATIRRSMPAGG